MNLDYHEPPRGDFVALIDRMVGMPPSDPEIAARELTEQLRRRAEAHAAASQRELSDTNDDNLDGLPDIGEAMQSMARSGFGMLLTGVSRLLILAGIAILAVTGFAEIPLPLVEPVHGIGAIIAGVILNNATS
jgi:hypothetical protein